VIFKKKAVRNPDGFFHFCSVEQPKIFPFRTILLYGLALGLLLASLQTVRYRLLVVDHAFELYLGLIAVVFAVIGLWLGRRGVVRQTGTTAHAPLPPLDGAALERTLAQYRITQREYEVLQLIARGLSNQEIAAQMFVSLNTVKTHTSNLFSKLDAQRRTQAVERARALGLIAPLTQKHD
jgi:NarL family two-component system response regulator LiaR